MGVKIGLHKIKSPRVRSFIWRWFYATKIR